MTLGAAAAVGRLSTDPQALLKHGSKLFDASPHLSQVAGLGRPLATAGKAAAVAAVSHGIDSVGDRMQQRADALRGGQEAGAEPERESRRRGEPEGEYPEDEFSEGDDAEAENAEAENAEAENAEAEEEPEPTRPVRRRAARPTPTARTRRRPADEDAAEAPQPSARRIPRERSATAGAPVRRRGKVSRD